jgi:asparagine synthase (glutamine-hydrolysing)
MCGIAGFVDFRPAAEAQLLRQAKAMAQCLAYRGPDDSAEWAEADAGFATGHRRLSVVDLSPAGAQPMVSHCGRFVLSYNGEVYNAAEMRAELQPKGHAFRGHSDTEVMLAAVAQWGIGAAVKRFIGMFAFALWDRRDRRLWLVRDRLGIKPLYWGQFGRLLVFASELKALRAHPGWQPEVDRDSVAAYLRFAYVPSPRSIYRGINKLPPGTILEIDERGECKIEAFWSLADVVREGQQQPFVGTDAEAESELTRLLGDAVERRMIADVPLGAFLSGGIDSSLVVALMQSKSNRPVRTFSIGFREQGYDEAPHAAAVAKHLGTDHTEFYVTSEDARGVIPKLADMYDEPFADSSQIPTYLISELTRRKVTVALSGDGGDELFCGYNRYLQAALHRTWLATVPRPLRSVAAKTIRTLPSAFWDRTLQFM